MMYVNPFWCGVVMTLFSEMVGILVVSLYAYWRSKNGK